MQILSSIISEKNENRLTFGKVISRKTKWACFWLSRYINNAITWYDGGRFIEMRWKITTCEAFVLFYQLAVNHTDELIS